MLRCPYLPLIIYPRPIAGYTAIHHGFSGRHVGRYSDDLAPYRNGELI
jgi:hypothetical protein